LSSGPGTYREGLRKTTRIITKLLGVEATIFKLGHFGHEDGRSVPRLNISGFSIASMNVQDLSFSFGVDSYE
jgi:hypothetical protein